MFKQILVPVDFSPPSREALDYAVALCRLGGAGVVLIHVIETIQYATPADLFGASANLGMLEEEQRRVAERELARVAARLTKRRIRTRTVIATGSPAQTIVNAARRLKVGLIVMATHGRTGLTHLLMGSVAEKVVRTSACPVLTLRPRARAAAPGRSRGSRRRKRQRP
ncbi:MAG: universal stress protein [Candidatus Binatia bacterium]